MTLELPSLEVGIYQYLKSQSHYTKTIKKLLKESKELQAIKHTLDTLPACTLSPTLREPAKRKKETIVCEEMGEAEEPTPQKKPKAQAKVVKKDPSASIKEEEKKHFQRVDPSKVEFLDERLRTNDYLESKPSSYGDKAYQALAPTRGADFKKEKNKKKKSTYKGGQIDTSQVHSIKFDSD